MASQRRRLDAELVRRGLCDTRSVAQAEIANGNVLVSGSIANKASRLVSPAEPIIIAGPGPKYVSRGGLKLEAALAEFNIDPSGKRAIDVGASTGGFTDCLLQHGAAQVVAIDVGRNQLHERLRADERVISLEQTDVRSVVIDDIGDDHNFSALGGPAPIVTVDVSFISLTQIVTHIAALATADIVALVKPQFEVGKQHADKGKGVIRDPDLWQQATDAVAVSFTNVGAVVSKVINSPITGASGNQEFLLHAQVNNSNNSGNYF